MDTELIHVKAAVTHCDGDGQPVVVPDATIAVGGGTILAVGPREALAERYQGAASRHFPAGTAFPGMVNAHHHVGLTPFQHGIADMSLEAWIVQRMAARAVPIYLDTLYAAFEMLESGVTTVQHLYANRSASPETTVEECGEILRAYRTLGMRVSLAVMFFDQNPVSYTGTAFYDRLEPAELTAIDDFKTHGDMSLAAHLETIAALRALADGDDLVRIQLAPGNLQWCSHDALERLAELSRSAGLPVHMHLLETPVQRAYADWRCGGKSPVAYLHALGFEGPGVTLGHGVWLRPGDIDELRQSGFSVCHNCSSNLRLSSGIAPVRKLLCSGINVALGIDEAGLNDDRDMLTELRLALHLHNAVDPVNEPYGLRPSELLTMATVGGARTTGFYGSIGSIEDGRAADFFVVDLDAAAYPAEAEQFEALDLLCYRGRARHVLATFVNGEAVFRGGTFAGAERSTVLAEIAGIMRGRPDGPDPAVLGRVGAKLREEHRLAQADRSWFTR